MNLDSNWSQHLPLAPLDLIRSERASGKIIFPTDNDLFKSLEFCPLGKIKVVILGQDPYHSKDQAHGLAFSVPKNISIPPSLRNIYRELINDLSLPMPKHGNLTCWAKQGVLLLNTVLTVEEGKAGSHHNKGWESFSDSIIQTINEKRRNIVFILWGTSACKKAAFVDSSRHYILTSTHPSPLSAYRGFFGSKPFSKTNNYLRSKGLDEIDWRVI